MFEKIQSIFYRPDWFRRQEFTGGQALSFYSLSILFLVLGFTLLLIPAMWGVNQFFSGSEWQEQKAVVQSLYPDDLVITIDDGKLTTNQTEPVVIPLPEAWHGQGVKPSNLLVIDRDAEVSRNAMERYDTWVLATETEIGFWESSKGSLESFSLKDFDWAKTIEVTNASFDYWVIERGGSIVKTVTLFLMSVLPLLLYIGLWVGYIVYSVFGALVVWLAAHLRQHKLTYGQAYRSTLYLLPASFLLSLLMSLGNWHIPLLFSLVLFVMAFLNFEKRPKVDAVAANASQAVSPVPITPARADESQ